MKKPARLNALTGLRCFAAVNIVLFHFSNPQWFGPLAPVVNAGYASVSFFILLSGYVMGYNYAEKARRGELEIGRFYEARFTRLYPIYLLSLLLAWKMIPQEWAHHSPAMFWTGMILSPLLLQGWVPGVATFLNTPAWTMSAEAFYYVLFPLLARARRTERLASHLWKMAGVWVLGILPGAVYYLTNPDHLAVTDRWSYGPWLQALKYTPLPHLPSFVFGVMLATVDEHIGRSSRLRTVLGCFGFLAVFWLLELGPGIPYAVIHDGLLMPLFGCIILGLAGNNWLARGLGWRPLVFVGQASYCLYLLHFNLWNLVHDSKILDHTGLIRFDPWLSYVLLIGLALAALYFVEKPVQRLLRGWMHVWRD